MAHLSLSLLGPFQVSLDGEAVNSFESSKVRALLAYLAVEADRPHARDALAGLLWTDRPNRAALANLRNALANLRSAIGDRAATPPYLTITRDTIQFNAASDHWVDVHALRTLVGTPGTDRQLARRLEEVVALYRGDFLAGFLVRGSPGFEDWALLVREQLQRQVLDALRRLVGHHTASGEVEQACTAAWRLVELAPWEEEAHQQLMRLLALSGRRAAALAQYEACRQALAQELGVTPSPETTALYEGIRDGKVSAAASQHALPASPSATAGPGSVVLPPYLSDVAPDGRPTLPFVAREHELAQLDAYLQETLSGQGRAVFITGEAGTGKTALLQAFARRAQAQHADLIVAGGACSAYTGTGDPYLPFREILGQLTGDVEPPWASGAVSTVGARRVWDLIPYAVRALLERAPSLIDTLLDSRALAARAATAAPGGAPWRDALHAFLSNGGPDGWRADPRRADLYLQVTAFLSALARQHPLLLTVDDLHWVDAGSLDLLFHLGRRLSRDRILVIGAYRPSELALDRENGRHPLAQVIHEFRRQSGPIEVGLLQAGDRPFLEAYLDSEPNALDTGFRDALYAHTGGHALSVVEMLRGMQERGDLVRDGNDRWVEGPSVDWAALPARVRGVVGARIDRLPATLRDMLKVASVEGEAFTAEVVARVLGTAEYEVVARLADDLDRGHRLVASEGSERTAPDGQRMSRYRFRHILFQEYVYRGLGEAERAYLHEAVGDALERLHRGQTGAVAVQLARHYDAAARMDKAAEYALQAGDAARRLHAHAEARGHYDRALEALARLPDTERNRRRRADALLARTISSAGTDPWETNLDRLGEAERLAQALPGPNGGPGGDPARLARIHLWMGRTYYPHGRYRECISYYQRALAAARELGDAELIGLSSGALGHAFGSRGHFGQAEALLRQVMDLLEEAGDRGERARARMLHGSVLVHLGDYAEGVAGIQRAYAQLREMNALGEMSFNRLLLSLSYRAGGDLPCAIEAARQGLALAEQTGRRVSIYDGYMCLSWALCRAGQFDAAADYARRSRAILEELGGRLVLASELAALDAEIALGAGRLPEALSLAERAVAIAQDMDSISGEGRARRAWGQALAALETPQWDEAEAQLASSLRLFESGQARLEAARTRLAWGTVCRDRGDLAGAQAHWERAAAQWERSGLERELARTRALMETVAAASRTDEAVTAPRSRPRRTYAVVRRPAGERPAAHLSLRLLGSFQVSLDGEAINSFRTDKAQALLAYLAMHAGIPSGRTLLAGTLWADYEEASARTNLRQALRRLRTAIRDVDAPPPFLLATRTTITLNPESDYWLDVDAFAGALDAVRSHTHRSLETCAACAERLAEAVALYRGAFLSGFSLDSAPFEEWMVVERERLHEQALEALGHLAVYYEVQRAHEETARYARRALALEPWREEAHRALMRALALAGQRSAALAQYEACRDVLREELGVDPAQETTTLYERIRDGEAVPGTRLLQEDGFLHNLPAQLTPFVGREGLLTQIEERLADRNCRLLTLVGPGGSGKTRLALEAASRQLERYEHGVFFVSLAPLGSVEAIVPTVAQAIGFSFSGGADPKEQLLAYLRRKSVLLVMDNYEHLLEGASLATDILRVAPEVSILATSRAGLGVQGEHLYPIAGMDVPQEGTPGGLQAFDAVQLFLSAALRARPDLKVGDEELAHVAAICRCVEGMPLALLLAASWSRMLTPAEIEDELAAQLGPRIDFLEADVRDAPARHRSMRTVFDHSWRLLPERAQQLFAELSVFRGGFVRAAAQEVTGASLRDLMSLVGRSLLHRTEDGGFEMHELLRQYASEQLDRSPEASAVAHHAHCAYYAAALARWAADLKGPRQQTALAEMEREIENVHAAWLWAVEQGEAERLDQALEGLGLYHEWRARYEEGETAFRAAANRLAETGQGATRWVWIRALIWQGLFNRHLGRSEIARQRLRQGLSLLEGAASADQDVRLERALALQEMGWVECWAGEKKRAGQLSMQSLSLCRAVGDQWATANALLLSAMVAQSLGKFAEAERWHRESLDIHRARGTRRGIVMSLLGVGIALSSRGLFQEAERLVIESVAISRELGIPWLHALALRRLALVRLGNGEFPGSLSLLRECLVIHQDLGDSLYMALTPVVIGEAKAHLGHYQKARADLEQGLTRVREIDHQWGIGVALSLLGHVSLAKAKYVDAQRWLQESVSILQKSGDRSELGRPLALLAGAARGLRQLAKARDDLHKALEIAAEMHDWSTSTFALPVTALLLADRGEVEWAVEIYALASSYPFVANSRWFEDAFGQPIAALAAALPPEAVVAAQERGRARDLWATVEELLAELEVVE